MEAQGRSSEKAHDRGLQGHSGLSMFQNAHHFSIDTANIHVHYTTATASLVDDMIKIAGWLSGKNYRVHHNDIIAQHTPGTGQWLLRRPEFEKWGASEKNAVLWVTGMPGAGKTFLASIVIEDQLRRSARIPKRALVFVYCRYLDRCTTHEVLCTFLRQLLETYPAAYEQLKPSYDSHQAQQTHLTAVEVLQQLQMTLSLFTEAVAVVDGLDEIPDEEKYKLMDVLTSLPLQLIIFSRPLDDIAESIPAQLLTTLNIEANNEDIEIFALERIRASRRLQTLLRQESSLQRLIITKLKEKSGGMFLVAALQMEALMRCMNVKSITNVLNSLPSGVNDMYCRTMKRIEDQDDEEVFVAKRTLLWLAYSRRPLKVDELQDILATSIEERSYDRDAITPFETILSVCCGLVVVDKSSKEAHLIHYTAQEYITELRSPPFSVHPAITTLTCTTYLSHHGYLEQDIRTLEELNLFVSRGPSAFLSYAQQYWAVHAQALEDGDALDAISHTADFLRRCRKVVYPLPMLKYFNFPFRINADHEVFYPCHVAASHGLLRVLALLGGTVSEQKTDRYGWNTLHVATLFGHHDFLSALFQGTPRTFDVNSRDVRGRAALHLAVQEGHGAIAQLLLAQGAIDVNRPDSFRSTPLCIATHEEDVSMITLLLSHPLIQANAPNRYGEPSFLQALVDHGPTVAGCFLAYPGVDVNASNGRESALQIAIRRGYWDIAKKIVAREDLNVNWTNDRGQTALHLALQPVDGFAISPILEQLLSHHRIDVTATGPRSPSPLALAVSTHRNLEAARLLLVHPSFTRSSSSEGSSLLADAIITHNDALCDLLLSLGFSNPTTASNGGLLPLILAMEKGDQAIFRLILSHIKAPVDLDEPINHAIRTNRGLYVEELLLSHVSIGGNSNKVETTFISSLHHFLRDQSGREADATWMHLLSLPPTRDNTKLDTNHLTLDINHRGSEGLTALMLICRRPSSVVVRALLARDDIDVNVADDNGCTALTWATTSSSEGEQEGPDCPLGLLLSDKRTDVNRQDSSGMTALWYAILVPSFRTGVNALVSLLSHPDIDVNIRDKNGNTPLHLAAGMWDFESSQIHELLAHEGIDVNAVNDDGKTPIHIAIEHHHRPVLDAIRTRNLFIPTWTPHSSKDITASLRCCLVGPLAKPLESFRLELPGWDARKGTEAPLATYFHQHYFSKIVAALARHPGINLNIQDRHGRTPLHAACRIFINSNLDFVHTTKRIVTSILKNAQWRRRNIDLAILDNQKDHCLSIVLRDLQDGPVLRHQSIQAVAEALLARDPGLLNLPFSEAKETLAHLAIRTSNACLADLLSDLSAQFGVDLDLDMPDGEGRTPRDCAAACPNDSVLESLGLKDTKVLPAPYMPTRSSLGLDW